MTEDDISHLAADADLASGRFIAGVARGHWKILEYHFPVLIVAVNSAAAGGRDFAFRFELTGFKRVAPEAHIWDVAKNQLLPPADRPAFSPSMTDAFKDWGNHTVYRPWERQALAHGEWARKYPQLAWHPERNLAFALEDLYAILSPTRPTDG